MKPRRHFFTPQFDLVPQSPPSLSSPPQSATSTSGEPQPAVEPSSSTTADLRPQCSYTSSDGRHCRMLRSPDHPDLCDHHAHLELKSLDRTPTLPLAAQLLGPVHDLRSAAAINAVMGNAFVQLADGRLDPRRAAILTYMAQLIMQTLKKVGWEKIDRSPTPDLEKALQARLKAPISKSSADKLIRTIYSAALQEAGPAALRLGNKD